MHTLTEMMDLSDSVALVTGGRGWLGSAICEALTELRATVVSVGRGESESFSKIPQIKLDLDDFGEDLQGKVADLLAQLEEMLAIPRVLVNNMCVWPKEPNFMETHVVDIEDSLESNIAPQLYLTQQLAARMQPGSSIINIASMYGKVAPDLKMYRGQGGNALMYGAAKAALIQSTKYLAGLLGPKGIRVNSISPGPFPRPGVLDDKDWFKEELSNRTMLGRVADREEMKGAIALLATDMGSYITGEDIAVDGGWTAW